MGEISILRNTRKNDMKKNCFIFLFSFIYLSILAGCHIRPDEYEEFQNISLIVIGKQIAVET